MIFSIENDFLKLSVSELGSEIQSILACDGTEFVWQGDPKYWDGHAPTLFPCCANMYGGKYDLDGQTYSMPLHGFAPTSMFKGCKISDTEMTMTLEDNEETYALYPRHFVFCVRYVLEGKMLKVTYEIDNKDEKTMYFGLGGHPGFNVPFVKGIPFEDYRLRFENPCQPVKVGMTDQCFLNGNDTPVELKNNSIELRHSIFDHDAVVIRNMDRKVTLETDADAHSVTLSYPGMQFLGMWHAPLTDAPYICVEPWCSVPSNDGEHTVFEKKADFITLEAGKQYLNCWTMEFGGI